MCMEFKSLDACLLKPLSRGVPVSSLQMPLLSPSGQGWYENRILESIIFSYFSLLKDLFVHLWLKDIVQVFISLLSKYYLESEEESPSWRIECFKALVIAERKPLTSISLKRDVYVYKECFSRKDVNTEFENLDGTGPLWLYSCAA